MRNSLVITKNKLTICAKTRQLCAESLHKALATLLQSSEPISEVALRDQWLAELRTNPTLFSDGWYFPPPHGIGVLFSTDTSFDRVNYKSLRPEEIWPKKNIHLDRNSGIVYVYASPVDRETGIIGDFGMTIYFGNKSEIQAHLKKCFTINQQIMNHVEMGMSFAELTTFAIELFQREGLSNLVESITDPAGVNIGHTVPGSNRVWTTQEQKLIDSGDSDWSNTAKMISANRNFLSTQESLIIQPRMAFTLEPRLTVFGDSQIPMSSFHTIIVINEDGTPTMLTNFDKLFHLVGMDYMTNHQ